MGEETQFCPKCNRPIPPDAPGGICPHCAFQDALSVKGPTDGGDASDWEEDLLLGLYVFLLRYVSSSEFSVGVKAWLADPARPLASHLEAQGALTPEKRAFVERLVLQTLGYCDGDMEAAFRLLGGRGRVSHMLSVLDETTAQELTTRIAIDLEGFDAAPIEDLFAHREELGRYTRSTEYSRGGMGRIFIVHDELLIRDVALKELLPLSESSAGVTPEESPIRGSGELLARFLKEARITGRLEHPTIVPVYELGRRPSGAPYYTMRLVRGKTLARALDDCATLEERLRLLPNFVDLCMGIAYAHSKDIVHRDIKPTNVMVGEFGETVIIDWGLAKLLGERDEDAEAQLQTVAAMRKIAKEAPVAETREGLQLGTPAYMSPEQAAGRINEIDPRSDNFSLGIVLYRILTGELPFQGKTAEETMALIQKGHPLPPGKIEPHVPRELASICMKALALEKAKRYPSAQQLAEDIRSFLTGSLVGAYNYSARERFARYYRRHRAALNTAAAALVLLLATGAVSYYNVREARDEALVALDAEAEARRNATEARDAEATARAAEEVAREEAERRAYINQIRLAHSYIEQNNEVRAREILWETSPQLRNWEWGYLLNLAHRELYTIEGYQGFAISPDGELIAASYRAKPIGIFNAGDGALLRELSFPAHLWVESLEFSLDSTKLLVKWQMPELGVWDVLSGEELNHLRPHEGPISAVQFSPNGDAILAIGQDGTLLLLDAETGEVQRRLSIDADAGALKFSTDGSRIAGVVANESLHVWDASTGESLLERVVMPRIPFDLSPSGSRLAIAGRASVDLLDVDTAEVVAVLEDLHSRIVQVRFSPDEQRLLVAGAEGSLNVWDTATGDKLMRTAAPKALTNAAWSPDGSYILVSRWQSNPEVVNAATGDIVTQLAQHETGVAPWTAFFPDSTRVGTSGGDGRIKISDALTTPGQRIAGRLNTRILDVQMSSDGAYLALLDDARSLTLVDMEQGQTFAQVTGGGSYPFSFADLSLAGEFIAFMFDGFVPFVVRTNTGELVSRYFAHESRITAVVVGPDEQIASASADGAVHLWDAVSGRTNTTFSHPAEPTALAFNSSGARLAVGDQLGGVAVYDSASGEQVQAYAGLVTSVDAVAWSPDGAELAASADGEVHRWQVATGALLGVHGGHLGPVNSITYPPSGERVVTASGDSVRVWDTYSGEEILGISGPGQGAAQLAWASSGGAAPPVAYSVKKDQLLRLWEPAPWHAISSDPSPKTSFARYRTEQLRAPLEPIALDAAPITTLITTREHLINALIRLRDALTGQASDVAAGLDLTDGARYDAVKRIGLRPGDRITAINSTTFADEATARQQLNKLIDTIEQRTANIEVTVERHGRERTTRFALEEPTIETRRVTTSREEAADVMGRLAESLVAGIGKSDSRELATALGEAVTEQANHLAGFYFQRDITPEDQQMYIRFRLSPFDRALRFNDEPITDFDTFRIAVVEAADAVRSGERTTFTFDIERGEFQQLRFVYYVQ